MTRIPTGGSDPQVPEAIGIHPNPKQDKSNRFILIPISLTPPDIHRDLGVISHCRTTNSQHFQAKSISHPRNIITNTPLESLLLN